MHTTDKEDEMLVLSRKQGESVIVKPPGEVGEANVLVIQIKDDRIRLAFDIPRDWEVYRAEIRRPPGDGGTGAPVPV
jgi:carbon storage regulator CsrA